MNLQTQSNSTNLVLFFKFDVKLVSPSFKLVKETQVVWPSWYFTILHDQPSFWTSFGNDMFQVLNLRWPSLDRVQYTLPFSFFSQNKARLKWWKNGFKSKGGEPEQTKKVKVHLTPNTISAKMQTWNCSKSDLTFFATSEIFLSYSTTWNLILFVSWPSWWRAWVYSGFDVTNCFACMFTKS